MFDILYNGPPHRTPSNKLDGGSSFVRNEFLLKQPPFIETLNDQFYIGTGFYRGIRSYITYYL